MISRLLLVVGLVLASHTLARRACAQAANGDAQSGYTLHANARVVLTDVTVTDKQGNPVHGLTPSDFRVFDNNKSQEVASFEEHGSGDPAPQSPPRALPAGTYSNDYLVHPPRVLNVLFIDLTNMGIADQMYLDYQLGKFFDTLKPDEPIAIYARPGSVSILLQGFTSDRAALRAAVRKLLPRFPPLGQEYMGDVETLHQIAAYLNELPGRKNVLWLSGGPMLFDRPGGVLSNEGEWRPIYDELETQRIAIYPIDVRGLMLIDVSRNQTVMNRTDTAAQHALMKDVAQATGGHAVYNSNGIALAVAHIVEGDGDYYTLTYSPRDFAYDNKWHKVRVTMPGTDYTLSYRRGYFADGTIADTEDQQPSRSRPRLRADGNTEVITTTRAPIVFEAQIHPGIPTEVISRPPATHAPRKGTRPYTVEASLPLDAFEIKRIDGKLRVDCGAEIAVLNSDGTLISHYTKFITFTVRDEAAQHPVGQELPLEEEIDLARGDVFVYVFVFDRASKRNGALEIPYHADASVKLVDAQGSGR